MIALFTTYLIYPILGLIMIVVAALLVKKNRLLKNKRLIVYTLLSIPILTVPALLGFLDYNFMPYAYIAMAGVYILAGFLNDRLLPWVFDNLAVVVKKRYVAHIYPQEWHRDENGASAELPQSAGGKYRYL